MDCVQYRRAILADPHGVSAEMRLHVATCPDCTHYTATVQRFEDRLARGLAHVINVLDPDVLVFGGGLSKVERIYQEVAARLPRYVFGGEMTTTLLPARFGDSSGVRGAAWLWPAPFAERSH